MDEGLAYVREGDFRFFSFKFHLALLSFVFILRTVRTYAYIRLYLKRCQASKESTYVVYSTSSSDLNEGASYS